MDYDRHLSFGSHNRFKIKDNLDQTGPRNFYWVKARPEVFPNGLSGSKQRPGNMDMGCCHREVRCCWISRSVGSVGLGCFGPIYSLVALCILLRSSSSYPPLKKTTREGESSLPATQQAAVGPLLARGVDTAAQPAQAEASRDDDAVAAPAAPAWP